MDLIFYQHICPHRYQMLSDDTQDITSDKLYDIVISNDRTSGRAVCYADMYSKIKRDCLSLENNGLLFSVVITRGIEKFIERKNHIFIFNDEEVILWLEEINKIIPFRYVIKKLDNENIEIKTYFKTTFVGVKLLSTLIRYLFEYGQCFVLKEAINLHKMGVYTDIDLFNLHMILSSLNFYQNTNHTISGIGQYQKKILKYDVLRKDFKNAKEDTYISDLIRKDLTEREGGVLYDETSNNIYNHIKEMFSNSSTYEDILDIFSMENTEKRYKHIYGEFINSIISKIKNGI